MPDPIQMIGADTSFNLFNSLGGVKKPTETLTKKDFKIQKQPGMSFGDFANGANSMLGSIGGGGKIGDMLAGIPDMFGANPAYGFSEDEKASQSAIRKGLEMIPVYGQAIAAATGIVDAIGSATGLNLSTVDGDTAKRAGITGTGFNKAMNMLPGNSMIWGGLSRLFGNERTKTMTISDNARSVSSSYSGTMKDLDAAQSLGNKQLFFGQTQQANDFITRQQANERLLAEIGRVNTQRKQSDYYQDLQNQNINRYAGQNYLNTTVGKNGMKLMSIDEARRIIALRKTEESPEKLQNGGNIPGIDTNLIPDGARHKNLNHLDELNPDLKDATKKGIPVTESTDNQQIAEIEVGEIIFRLEVTEQLEQLMKEGSDEAMIEAGKLVASELIENTQDNTGQITEENNNGKE